MQIFLQFLIDFFFTNMHLVTCDSIDYNRFIGMFVLPAKVGISQDPAT